MIELANTGERILLEKESALMIARHFCAYKFAKDFAFDKDVLDIGCGEGYGSHYLSDFSRILTGIDYDKDVIAYAQNKYKKENLKFLIKKAEDLAGLKKKFDLITCFQNIEHIYDAEGFLKGVRLALNDGGSFICSTCNRNDASPGSKEPFNKFHVREYLFLELKELLAKNFKSVEIFGLKRSIKLNFFIRLKKLGIFVKSYFDKIDCGDFIFVTHNLYEALDFIAVCRN